jgi:hypothetical protein
MNLFEQYGKEQGFYTFTPEAHREVMRLYMMSSENDRAFLFSLMISAPRFNRAETDVIAATFLAFINNGQQGVANYINAEAIGMGI